MNVNSELIKSYTKLSCVKSILQVPTPQNVFKKMNFNTISVNTKRLEQLEKDVFQNSAAGVWQSVGKTQLENRTTGELVDVAIKRRKVVDGSDAVAIRLMCRDKQIIDGFLSEPMNPLRSFGFEIVDMSKNKDGDELKGVAKLFDAIAVKESLNAGFNGRVQLHTGVGGARYESAEPLHWARGFKRFEYFSKCNDVQKKDYNERMQQLFEVYKKERATGKNIHQSKQVMADKPMTSVRMVLAGDVLQERIKQSSKIRYS